MLEAISQIYWVVIIGIVVVIGLAGGIYAGFNFWDSFTNDRPEEKKKAVTALIVTVVALVLILAIGGIMWGLMQDYLNQLPSISIPSTTSSTAPGGGFI